MNSVHFRFYTKPFSFTNDFSGRLDRQKEVQNDEALR